MAQQIIQQLTVYLKGGQTVVVPFNAEKAEVLNWGGARNLDLKVQAL